MKYSGHSQGNDKGSSSGTKQAGKRRIAENPYLDKNSAGSMGKGSRPMPQNPYAEQSKRKKTQKNNVELSKFIETAPSQRQRAPQKNGQPVARTVAVGASRQKQQPSQSGGRAGKINDNALRHKRRHKKNYILYYLMMFLILAATGITLSLTVFFNVGNISVEFAPFESEDISQNDIIAVSGVKLGDNMFRMSTKKLEEIISKKFITVETVMVKRSFPQTLSIQVVNAQPKAELSYEDKSYIISEKNRVMEVSELEKSDGVGLVRFTGSDIKGIKAGDFLTDDEKHRVKQIDLVLDAVEENAMTEVTSVDVSDIMAIKLYCGDQYSIKVGGTANLAYKLHCAGSIIEKELTDKTVKGVIDVSVDNGMYYFRPTDKLDKDDQSTSIVIDSPSSEPVAGESSSVSSDGEDGKGSLISEN